MASVKGLKKVSGETKTLKGFYDPAYLEIFYDISKNEIFSIFHVSIGHNAYTQFDDENIISICNAYEPMTMRELQEQVDIKLSLKAIF